MIIETKAVQVYDGAGFVSHGYPHSYCDWCEERRGGWIKWVCREFVYETRTPTRTIIIRGPSKDVLEDAEWLSRILRDLASTEHDKNGEGPSGNFNLIDNDGGEHHFFQHKIKAVQIDRLHNEIEIRWVDEGRK
jgi:hypothetical protein